MYEKFLREHLKVMSLSIEKIAKNPKGERKLLFTDIF